MQCYIKLMNGLIKHCDGSHPIAMLTVIFTLTEVNSSPHTTTIIVANKCKIITAECDSDISLTICILPDL